MGREVGGSDQYLAPPNLTSRPACGTPIQRFSCERNVCGSALRRQGSQVTISAGRRVLSSECSPVLVKGDAASDSQQLEVTFMNRKFLDLFCTSLVGIASCLRRSAFP
jgi:hypothetical protein